jgi:hypothetical protein
MSKLANKVAAVTGGSRGIGAAIATQFIFETLDALGHMLTKFLLKPQSLRGPILDLRSMPW